MKNELKEDLKKAKTIVREIGTVQEAMKKAYAEEQKLMQDYLDNAKEQLIKISENIPGYLLEKKEKSFKVELSQSETEEYLRQTGLEKDLLKSVIKKIEKTRQTESEKSKKETYKKPGFFTKISGRLFSPFALKIAKKDFFQNISTSLRKANMPYLIATYISIALLASITALFASLILSAVLSMIIGPYIWLAVIIIPAATFFIVLFYPLSEMSSIQNKIDDELPFAAMHMAAIASSGVEPSKVFTILASSEEYPSIKKEMRKIVNMINFYGYDLSTALKITAKTTSSNRLSELLNGLAATITGGGELKDYLEKIASDSLLDYKLRRKKFITVSETYADIYTGLLIAAPLMFMLILVLMNVVTGNIGGMSSTTIALIGIGAIALLNIGFLIFLEVSQPTG